MTTRILLTLVLAAVCAAPVVRVEMKRGTRWI